MGAGVAGLQAIATSRRLGAIVKGLRRAHRIASTEVESLGATFIQVEGAVDDKQRRWLRHGGTGRGFHLATRAPA
jgi:NAD(P) transhydrogenase subunit alpha